MFLVKQINGKFMFSKGAFLCCWRILKHQLRRWNFSKKAFKKIAENSIFIHSTVNVR